MKNNYSIIDGDRDVLATGETREQAIRNLSSIYEPTDFDCEDWDQVVSEWARSDDGIGEMMCIPSEDV